MLKQIKESPFHYISDGGRVYSTIQHKWLKTFVTKNGYENIDLHCNNHRIRKQIHRLVAEAFLPNPQCLPEVNHKNEIKTDNRVENLEWCNRDYNLSYGTGRRRMGKAHWVPVFMCDKKPHERIKRFPGIAEAARQLGNEKSAARIASCVIGKTPSAMGYYWCYADKGHVRKHHGPQK